MAGLATAAFAPGRAYTRHWADRAPGRRYLPPVAVIAALEYKSARAAKVGIYSSQLIHPAYWRNGV